MIPKHVGDVIQYPFELEVYECKCGYHLGIDATFLDQVEEVIVTDCPACGRTLYIE